MATDPEKHGSTEQNDEGIGLSRRQYLAAQSAVIGGTALGVTSGSVAADSHNTIENSVTIDTGTQSEKEVADTIFGRLHEFYGDDSIYPAAYSLHVKNPTFWRVPDYWFSGEIGSFFDVERDATLPYPWERVSESGVSFEHRTDGDHVAGDGPVPHGSVGYERITVDSAGTTGGLSQSIALPDFRTLEYDLGLSVRGTVDTVTASITTLDGDVLASTEVDVSGEWSRHEPTLELDEATDDRHSTYNVENIQHVPYGEYVVEFTTEGEGYFDIDYIELAAGDAIIGEKTGAPFNPTTIELLQQQNNTWLKWPGGNVTSQYNWEDGIGPIEERTPRFNHAWQGMQPNFYGTAEHLEFCELANQKPEITIGWHDNAPDWAAEREILPEDAANWVEYVNGSSDTEYGGMRAEHGYDEPWDVEHWGVGNEVWGSWQFGHTSDASEYATGSDARTGFDQYSQAMRDVDDSITVIASGWDPAEAAHADNPWNETLLDELDPDLLDGLNIHRYQWGFQDNVEAVQNWKEENDADNIDYNEVLVMASTQLGNQLEGLANMVDEMGYGDDFYLNLSELGIFPTVDEGAPYPGPETMSGGAYIAGALNAMIRLSDDIRWSSQTWVPVVVSPESAIALQPDGVVTRLYSALFKDDTSWYSVGAESDGASRDIPDTTERINPVEDMPYVDGAAMQDDAGRLATFVTNRNLRTASEVEIEVGEEYAGHPVEVVRLGPASDERPLPHIFRSSWESVSNMTVTQFFEEVDADGTITLTLEPAGVARLFVSDTTDQKTVGDLGVWGGMTYPEATPEPITGAGGIPADPDGDGKIEDINGDGNVSTKDIMALFRNRNHSAVQERPELFDLNDDGDVTLDDVIELFGDL